MKKIITSAVAAGLVLGTTANVAAQSVDIDRDAAAVTEAEGAGGSSLLIILIVAAAIAAGIILLEEDEDFDDLPTSP